MLTTTRSARPPLREGDTVMICKHLFETARRTLAIDWPNVRWSKQNRKFTREDGSTGMGDYYVRCRQCAATDMARVAFIEETFLHGKLHVADFLNGRGVPC
jgi:hypothetical protein